jgi:hypothetical protein
LVLPRLYFLRRSDRQRSGSFSHYPRAFGKDAHRAPRLVERDRDRAIDETAHPLPHSREDALPSATSTE